MIYALDTMVVSEPRKGRPHGAVLAWFAGVPVSSYITPAIVLYELQQGAEITRRQDPKKAAEIDGWIDSLLLNSIILPFSPEVARETARLMNRRSPNLFNDAAIAATALVHGLTVATRNTKDFKAFHVPLVNPFLFGRQ